MHALSVVGARVSSPGDVGVGEGVPRERVGEEVPRERVGEEVPRERVGEEVPRERVGEDVSKDGMGEDVPTERVGEGVPRDSTVGEEVMGVSSLGAGVAMVPPVGARVSSDDMGEGVAKDSKVGAPVLTILCACVFLFNPAKTLCFSNLAFCSLLIAKAKEETRSTRTRKIAWFIR